MVAVVVYAVAVAVAAIIVSVSIVVVTLAFWLCCFCPQCNTLAVAPSVVGAPPPSCSQSSALLTLPASSLSASLIIPRRGLPDPHLAHFAKMLANGRQLPCAAKLIFPRGAPLLLEDFRTGWRLRRRAFCPVVIIELRKLDRRTRPCNNWSSLNTGLLDECHLWGRTSCHELELPTRRTTGKRPME